MGSGLKRVKVGLAAETLEAIDQVRGDVPRERWIRRVVDASVRRRLANGVEHETVTRRSSTPTTVKDSVADVVASAAPREPTDAETKARAVMARAAQDVSGLLDHTFRGEGAQCHHAGCPAPMDRARHPEVMKPW